MSQRLEAAIQSEFGDDRAEICLNARGESICYKVCNRRLAILFLLVAALMLKGVLR